MYEKRTVFGPHLNRRGMCHFASIERAMSAYFKKADILGAAPKAHKRVTAAFVFPREKIEKSGHFYSILVMRRSGITYFAMGVCQEL